MRTWSKRGRLCGAHRTRARTATTATAKPSRPAMQASIRLSVRSCLIIRSRAAPKAERRAISRSLTEPCASSRLATFTQAIIKTNRTAPNSTHKARGSSRPVIWIENGTRFTLNPAKPSARLGGYCSSKRLPIAFMSACAWATVIPGFRRPMARPQSEYRSRRMLRHRPKAVSCSQT